ncbi:hypothetical protein Naga_102019g1 [Nannochloropsis gaditana]|uniref:Uncharacterized protein n=1 Tax=Nannochloropsis gaditana TaxID=72520 RepID=W7TRT4_9STRA|nr:hypothetical protein Naga_102019g1 [Nannochloropsis gaditana]
MVTPWEGKETRKRPGGGGNAFAQLFKKNSAGRGQKNASVYGREGEIGKETRTERNFFEIISRCISKSKEHCGMMGNRRGSGQCSSERHEYGCVALWGMASLLSLWFAHTTGIRAETPVVEAAVAAVDFNFNSY